MIAPAGGTRERPLVPHEAGISYSRTSAFWSAYRPAIARSPGRGRSRTAGSGAPIAGPLCPQLPVVREQVAGSRTLVRLGQHRVHLGIGRCPLQARLGARNSQPTAPSVSHSSSSRPYRDARPRPPLDRRHRRPAFCGAPGFVGDRSAGTSESISMAVGRQSWVVAAHAGAMPAAAVDGQPVTAVEGAKAYVDPSRRATPAVEAGVAGSQGSQRGSQRPQASGDLQPQSA